MNLFVEGYKDLITNDIKDYGMIGSRSNPLPSVPKPSIVRTLTLMNEYLSKTKPLLNLTGSFVVVGSINGGLHRLLQMLHTCGMPPKTKYIFLGNYIGEGEYSIEVMTLLISMSITFPNSVFLLKGAHETRQSSEYCKFMENVESTYDKQLAEQFSKVFDKLPLAATVMDVTYVCFGGFGPHTDDLSYVNMCRDPGADYTTIEREVIFAEPSEDIDSFDGDKFSGKEFAKFSKKNLIFRIIRAQQENKIRGKLHSFANGKVLSLFYDFSGVITIANDGSISTRRFDPIVPLKRSEVYFFSINSIATTLSSIIDNSKINPRLKIRVRLSHSVSLNERKMYNLTRLI